MVAERCYGNKAPWTPSGGSFTMALSYWLVQIRSNAPLVNKYLHELAQRASSSIFIHKEVKETIIPQKRIRYFKRYIIFTTLRNI